MVMCPTCRHLTPLRSPRGVVREISLRSLLNPDQIPLRRYRQCSHPLVRIEHR
jgi:hypothetical protein